MEVPADILEQLKCDNCQDYLSCSPVYLKNNGLTICGKCYVKEGKDIYSANRMLKYEVLAKLIKFPCKFKVHGCNEIVPFDKNNHELVCEFREHPCPVAEIGECDWFGQRKHIFGHFQSKHPTQIGKNPCNLTYDLTKSSTKIYFIQCFNYLFVLHTKICIATNKIYHSVKLLDTVDKVAQFKCTLEIKREELIISRPGKILPQNCVGIDEHTAIVTNITSLLDFLNGLSGTVFTIRIQKVEKDVPKPTKKSPKPVKDTKKPLLSLPEKPAITSIHTCRNKNQGCTFSDTKNKCEKHEKFFCSFRTWCSTCTTLPPINITSIEAWNAHYLTEHKHFTFESDSYFKIRATEAGQSIYVKTKIGQVYCQYFFK